MTKNITTYDEAIKWLYAQLPMFSRTGAPAYKPGLEMTHKLDSLFDNPHKKFRSIHIAGTNGKGSTSHMIAAVLQAQGYKVGLYTSPHLVDFRERIRVNGEMVAQAFVVDFVNDWQRRGEDLHPSFFELTMMMAFCYFASQKVDYAIIEVGMGGRLDSTNVITPVLSIITNIAFDHTQFLGTSLGQIAGEKAGIIKEGIPVVIGETVEETHDVFLRKAKEMNASVTFAEKKSLIKAANHLPNGDWQCDTALAGEFTSHIKGNYQIKNINTVLSAIDVLQKSGIQIEGENIRIGLENTAQLTGLMGRWQVMDTSPMVICDTAHNYAGLSQTMSQLAQITRDVSSRIRLLIGFVNDKDVEHIVALFPHDAEYYFTQAAIPRAMPVDQVEEFFSRVGIAGRSFASVAEAYEAIMADSSPSDIIYIGGSTFIVADFLAQKLKDS